MKWLRRIARRLLSWEIENLKSDRDFWKSDCLIYADECHKLKQASRPAGQPVCNQPFAVVIAGDQPGWTEEDRGNLRAFLNGETGARLVDSMNYYEQGRNRAAVLQTAGNRDYVSGEAAGFHRACAWVQQLSADLPPQEKEDNWFAPGAADLVERLAP